MDIQRFRADASTVLAKRPKQFRRYRSGWFLMGPVPGEWLGRAAALPGKSLHVALAIRHETDLKKNKSVKLCRAHLRKFAVLPDAARRALKCLEDARLIDVVRNPGQCPVVTVLEVDRDNS